MLKSMSLFGNSDKDKLNKLFSQIRHYREQYSLYFPLNKTEIKMLEKKFREEEIFSSNHIEGNSYSLHDTQFLLETGLAVNGKKLKDGIEIINIKKGIEYITAYTGEFTEEFVKKVHEIVTKCTLTDELEEKEYKQNRNYIGDIQTSSVAQTPIHMRKLIANINRELEDKAQGDIKIIEIINRFKYKFLVIHPFIDGNGRTIRLIYNYLMNKYDFISISILPEDKEGYYTALKNSNKDNVFALQLFMCEMIIKNYERRLDWLNEE